MLNYVFILLLKTYLKSKWIIHEMFDISKKFSFCYQIGPVWKFSACFVNKNKCQKILYHFFQWIDKWKEVTVENGAQIFLFWKFSAQFHSLLFGHDFGPSIGTRKVYPWPEKEQGVTPNRCTMWPDDRGYNDLQERKIDWFISRLLDLFQNLHTVTNKCAEFCVFKRACSVNRDALSKLSFGGAVA